MSSPSKFPLYSTAWYPKRNCYVSLVDANQAKGTWYFNVHNSQENIGQLSKDLPGQHIVTQNELSNFVL